MPRSPQSRGKGSRRRPWRDGGDRKWKRAAVWQHRAQHMVKSAEKLQQPVATINFSGAFGEDAGLLIYRFDQEMARIGVRYAAVLQSDAFRTAHFTIHVPTEHADAVAAILARLQRT